MLCAVPALVASGLFAIAQTVYGAIGPAFYGTRTTFMTLLMMAVGRIKRPEALKEHDPQALGRVLGLDRAPEVKTVRRKLAMGLGGALALMTVLGAFQLIFVEKPDPDCWTARVSRPTLRLPGGEGREGDEMTVGEPLTTEDADAARAALRRAVRVAAGLESSADHPFAARLDAFLALEATEVLREVDALLAGPRAGAGLEQLRRCGALAAFLPEVQALVGLHEDTARSVAPGRNDYAHKDVWAHTCKVVDQSLAEPVLRWAALLHDVGKARTRTVEPDGTVHFLGHAEVGARMARRILRRFGVPAERSAAIRFLVLHHLRAAQYAETWTDSAVRRFALEMEGHLDALLALSRADITTRRAARLAEGLRSLDELERRVHEIREADSRPVALPKGLGNALIEAFGLSPGPVVGKLRRAIEEAAERGALPMQAEPEVYIAWAREHLGHLLPPAEAGEKAPEEAGG